MKESKSKFFNKGHWTNNACLSCGPADYSWYAYCDGFYNSANIIAASILNDDFISDVYKDMVDANNHHLFSMHRDTCVFPMVFLYSHYIELCLKRMILRIQKLLNINTFNEVQSGHCLFNLCSKLLENYNILYKDDFWGVKKNNVSNKIIRTIKSLLPKLQDIDDFSKKSITSRYPADENNKSYLLNEPPLNIKTFAKEMITIHGFFEMIDYELYDLEEYLQIRLNEI